MIFGKKSFDLNKKKSVDLNQLDLNQLNPAIIVLGLGLKVHFTMILRFCHAS